MRKRDIIVKVFKEGWWRKPLAAYRLWRAENRRWGSTKEVWEYIGKDRNVAYFMMNGSKTEEELQESGQRVAYALRVGLGIGLNHKVLEVGCGVARIGRELAPYCGEWWGCDISDSIIRIARKRTAHLKNVNFKVLSDNSLRDFGDNVFDRTYCHAVFMHLPQMDIFAYIREMGRVTKPGGLIFYDALNLSTEEGWARFIWEIKHYEGRKVRPIHHSRFATPQELIVFTQRAGLSLLHCLTPGCFVQIVATKVEGLTVKEREALLEELRGLVDPKALALI